MALLSIAVVAVSITIVLCSNDGISRMPFIGGNWKCNGPRALSQSIVKNLNNISHRVLEGVEVLISVPSVHLQSVASSLDSIIAVGSQDVGINSGYGAFTGEVSAALLMDMGIRWTLTGHSERRIGFGYPGETNEVVGKKTARAVAAGMSVIACIGEQLADRESGQTMTVCSAQLAAIAAELKEEDWSKVVIAYEPVWAIGTGKVATPEQAEETHANIRHWLAAHVSPAVAAQVRVIYGGSVKANNCKALISCPNIDGFLVGGASLLPEFVDIIQCGRNRHFEEL